MQISNERWTRALSFQSLDSYSPLTAVISVHLICTAVRHSKFIDSPTVCIHFCQFFYGPLSGAMHLIKWIKCCLHLNGWMKLIKMKFHSRHMKTSLPGVWGANRLLSKHFMNFYGLRWIVNIVYTHKCAFSQKKKKKEKEYWIGARYRETQLFSNTYLNASIWSSTSAPPRWR